MYGSRSKSDGGDVGVGNEDGGGDVPDDDDDDDDDTCVARTG